ncbi:MAG: HD domain-containing protein [Chitinophagaceae bacterium]|nr:HD domain-containing protein [Oligoflexus sp.]
MTKHSSYNPSKFKALRVCELPNEITYFDLFLEYDGEMVPYTKGRHQWSTAEKVDLLQSSQFVVFFESSKLGEVQDHLEATTERPVMNTEGFSLVIADGISEFIKARYAFPLIENQAPVFKAMATALSRFLYQQPRIRSLLEQMAEHDPYTFYHCMRTAAYAVTLSDDVKLWDVALGAVLHDIGNLYMSPSVLNRRGPLKPEEWKQVRKHPEDGVELLKNLGLSPTVIDMVLHHHERPDGEGYPHRFKKKDLTLEVRVLSFAEVFAALVTPRPYQAAHSAKDAYELMTTTLAPFLDSSLFASLARLIGLETTQQDQKAS